MAKKTNYEKNGHQYYRTSATLGKDVNGKPIRKEFYGKNKKEAEAKRDEYLTKIKSDGLMVNFDKVVFHDLFKVWLFEVNKISVKDSTFEREEGIYRNYIVKCPFISLALNQIKPIAVQRYYSELGKTKTRTQILHVNKLLRKFFNYAVREEYITRNPCHRIVMPEGISRDNSSTFEIESSKIDPFDKEEIYVIKEKSATSQLGLLFLLALGTGLRQGELLGLTLKDTDIMNKEVIVNKTLKVVKIFDNDRGTYKTLLGSPKTKSSVRKVPIPTALVSKLEQHIAEQKEKFFNLNKEFVEDSLIFTSSTGKPLNGRNISKSWMRFLKKSGIRYRNFHNLRHTYATQLFEADVPLKTVQVLLGHSSIDQTANTYTHVMPKKKISDVDKINFLFE